MHQHVRGNNIQKRNHIMCHAGYVMHVKKKIVSSGTCFNTLNVFLHGWLSSCLIKDWLECHACAMAGQEGENMSIFCNVN